MSKRSERMEITSNDLLALRIRNLIAAREFNTAEANRELDLGGWTSDHRHEDNMLAEEIDKLIEQANAEHEPRAVTSRAPCSCSAELDSAIRVIGNVAGFDDDTTAVGEAWAVVLRHLQGNK